MIFSCNDKNDFSSLVYVAYTRMFSIDEEWLKGIEIKPTTTSMLKGDPL